MSTHLRNVVGSTVSHQLQREEKEKKNLFCYCQMHMSKVVLIKPQTLMSLLERKIVY